MNHNSTTLEVLSIEPSRKATALADLKVQITTEVGTITLNDCRILKNRQNEAWFALPTYSVSEGKGYAYSPAVVLSPALKRQVSDTALEAFEAWSARPMAAGILTGEVSR